MNRARIFSAFNRSRPAAPRDEAVIYGVQHDARYATPSGEQTSFAGPGVHISDEVKRRQIALIARYVSSVRAR